jgi:hypothetical protein
MLLSLIASSWAAFGGAEIGVVGEADELGNEVVLELGVIPWRQDRDRLELDWAEVGVGWSWMNQGGRLDSFDASALSGRVVFGSGNTGAGWSLGELHLDNDQGVIEAGFARGGMSGRALEDQLSWDVGVDMHYRWVGLEEGLLLGVPLSMGFELPLMERPFVGAGAHLRPSFGLVGDRTMTWDGGAGLVAGVHAVQESQASLDVLVRAGSSADSFTQLSSPWVHRASVGMRARF